MSHYGSLNTFRRTGSKNDLATGMTFLYSRSEAAHGGGHEYEPPVAGIRSSTFSRATVSKGGGMVTSGFGGGTMGGMSASMSTSHRIAQQQNLCKEYLTKAEYAIQAGSGDADYFMGMARDAIERLKGFAIEMGQMGQPNDNVIRSIEAYLDQLKGAHSTMSRTLLRRRSTRKSTGSWDENEKSFNDAMSWIAQQKRLIETAAWGDDPAALEQQLINHQRFHSSIQGAPEVVRTIDELNKRGERPAYNALKQEFESLLTMSHLRTEQLRQLIQLLQEICQEIMWVNEKEEEELVFDWGDKNVENYIPKKQEGYSKLMSVLEQKEKHLHKLKTKVKEILSNNHPASDKIEAYMDTLQTQWSWLLQITKCIDTHLKENGAYCQFFIEANDTNKALQNVHETLRKKFVCDKNTSLEDLKEILENLEMEKENIMDHKRQVKHLVAKSKTIVRLKPRYPEEKNSSGIIVKALTDYKQDQKVIRNGNEAILKDNSQRSKWKVTGPGGLDMLIPSVCLIIPPPNPLSISLANKNEQYFEAILSIWNQLYINVKSLIAWHYCLIDINYVNSLTISMLSKMNPDEYRQIMKKLQIHFEEFKISSQSSEMFADEDKKKIEDQVNGAQAHYDKLVVELPTYSMTNTAAHQEQIEVQQVPEQRVQPQLFIIQQQPQQHHQIVLLQQEQQQQQQLLLLQQQIQQQEQETQRQQQLLLQQQQQEKQQQQAAAEEEARRLEEERRQAELKKQVTKEVIEKEHVIKKDAVKVTKTEPRRKISSSSSSSSVFSSSSHLLSELHALRLRMDAAEGSLSRYVHICFGDDGAQDCGLKIIQLESVQDDVDSMRQEYVRLRERILRELENINDLDKAQFLRSEVGVINQRLGSLESSSSAYVLRLRALRDMLDSIARADDIVKVHEARLTEKETTSLSPPEVSEYMETLKNMKAELMKKKDVLTSMESELSKASHWNSQMGDSFHRCDLMLSKFSEQVGLLSDRWRRIQTQIDTRLQDLQLYMPQLQHYKQTSTSITEWIEATRKKQDALQATKIESVQALMDHIANQKTLNTEIKMKRETVDSVLRDNEACVNTIRDYETDIASYSSGLETLLNVPIKRTMLKSPSMDLNQEAVYLQTRYMELFTLSSDYYKFLGELLKNMEELKMRNTQIDLLEEELRRFKEEMQERDAKNKSLEEAVAQFKLQLSQSQEQLLSLEEVKQTTALQCSATKDSLDSTQSKLSDLNNEVERLKYLLGEEKRKTKLAEERYTQQQEEYESALRKRQKELDTVSRSKMEVEKSLANKEHDIEQLRRQLADESASLMDLQKEMSKVRSHFNTEINSLKLSYESQIQISNTDIQRLSAQRDNDTAELQIQYERMEAERRNMEDELRRLRTLLSQTEEQKKRVEEEACNQRAMLMEDGHRRRELESQIELLMRERDEERNQYRAEMSEVLKTLEEKNDQLVYVTHSLEEETRRRNTMEEGQVVLEQSLAQLQVKLISSSEAATQLKEREEELFQTRLQLERENKERCRVEQNMSRLQGRVKDLQLVRDSLEGQVENLREAHQEEIGRRMQVEAELEKTNMTMTEYTSTITILRQSQELASTSEKRGEEERICLKEELEKTLRQNQSCSDQNTQLRAELKSIKQQLLQEQSRVKEANLRNEGLYKTIEEKNKTLNESSAELERLKEVIETQTKERLSLDEELRAVRQDKEELLKSKKGIDDELSSQITALELQLKASECCNAEHRNLVSELSSEREKLKLEAEKVQKHVTETKTTIQSLQSKYSEIVSERDSLLLKLQRLELDKEQMQRLEEELSRLKLSLESEFRTKQRLQEENERVKRDLSYWKDQFDGKQSMIRQYDTDKDILEREKKSLKIEIERLMKELRELEEKYKSKMLLLQKELQDVTVVRQTMESELKRTREPPTPDASSVVFDGVRKPVTAKQLLDSGVLDKSTYNQLVKGHKTVADVSAEKKVPLKGTGPIAGVIIESPKGPGSSNRPLCKLTFTEAKKENLLPPDSVDLLLDAQAATGHIIDPRTNQKLTVEEAYNQGVVDDEDRERLLAAEAAAVGYNGPGTNKPLSTFQAMKKGLIDKNTTLRLLQAQESVGGILDPILSVFLPRDSATERNLIDDNMCYSLNQRPELYLDPETEKGVTYMALKRRCKIEPHTGLLLLPIPEKLDPSNLVFDGVRKPVTAKQLLDCGVLDKPTYKALENGKKTVPDVSEDKAVNLKGTGPIAGVIISGRRKMSLTEAKQQLLLPNECADLLLEAQAATGHIIDPKANKKLTVEEACAKGVVDINDMDRLLASEAAAIGYKDPNIPKPISVFQAMKTGLIDDKNGMRLLQAQESVGGILDPNLSVFLPNETAIKRNLLDKNICKALNQIPEYYIDPETEQDISYQALKERCKVEPHSGLLLLPITEKLDPSKLIFDGVRKPVTAKQLVDCGVLDRQSLNKLMKGDKTVPDVSVEKKIPLKGNGSIAGVTVEPFGKMSLSKAKIQMLIPPESADLLLEAQAATGHIIDPMSNQKLTVEEACARGLVDKSDRDKLLAAEAAAVGYKDPHTGKSISLFDAIKKGLIDKKTGVRLLQAQESAGGILDPNLSVFLPKDTAIKRNLLDEDLCYALNQNPDCFLDPDTERVASYGALRNKCKKEPHTGLMLLPLDERKDPTTLMFDGVRKPVSAKQLLECGVLDKATFNKLIKGKTGVPEVSVDKKIPLKGTGSISGVTVASLGKLTFSEAKKQMLIPPESADLLLEAQAATGHIIDPISNQKLTVEEACVRGVVDKSDRDKLLAAEAGAVGYKDPHTGQSISVFEAIKKGLIDKKTGVRLLQAQESAGGILDPNLSVFLPKETAIKRNLLDADLCHILKQKPECYLDPDAERDASYDALKNKCKTEPHTGLMFLPLADRTDPSKLIFDGVRKPVSARQLLESGVLDKPTFNKLIKGEKTVPDISEDKKIPLKGTGSIAGVTVGSLGKMTLSKAKKQMLIPPEIADLLLEAQAATGHIIDPMSNQKLTVEEACARGVVDKSDQNKLLEAEAAAVGYKDPKTRQSLSVFDAIKKGLIDKKTGVRLLQAQESAGGILDPNLSVFLPKETAIKRNLLDADICHSLNQKPECYLDPDTERDASYDALKNKCKKESHTGLILLPLAERKDPSKLMFDGVRKPVSAQQLLECGVLDKPTFNKLIKGEKTVPDISEDKKVFLKGTGSIAGITVGSFGKVTLSNAKKQMLIPPESADLLLEAQAATGHIIDPISNQKLTVEEACVRGVVDKSDRDKLLAAEAAAVGYKDPQTGQSLSVFDAIKKGLIDKKTGVRLLQAQESAGGILDPNLSVFLPKETAIKRNLLDADLCHSLNQKPECYLDPDTERDASYDALKNKCKKESHTGLILLPLAERKDPSKLMFDGVRKPVSAQQLLECGVLDKPTFNKLIKGEKTVPDISEDKKVFLKGTGSIAGITVGSFGKVTLSNAKKQMLIPPESADLLLEAQAATGYIIDPMSNQKLTVEEACVRGVVDKSDRDKLLAAEAAAVGYKDPQTGQSLSVFDAIKKGLIDKKTGVCLLQAQESAGGILDPNLSVFLPKDTAIKRNLLDADLCRSLNQKPECYLDPDTERDSSYDALKNKCKTEPETGLMLLPLAERKDPSKIFFDGVRKPISALQLLECGVLDKSTLKKLINGEKTAPEVSLDKKVSLKGTGPIAGVCVGRQGNISFSEAKKMKIISEDSADLLLEAQAATGHIIDPKTDQKMTVEVACIKGVVDFKDQSRLLAAEGAAVGYKDPVSGKLVPLFEAMKQGVVDETTGLRLLQAQDSVGGILDPNLSIFLPKDTAIKRNLLDKKLLHALKQNPPLYLDLKGEHKCSYTTLKAKCNTNTHTGLHIFPVSEKIDPSKLLFDSVQKTVTAQQLLDCGVLDKQTFDQLMKGKKTVSEVSVDIKIYLKGTGSIGGVAAGPLGKMSFTEAKQQKVISSDSANMLLLAQAATGHIIDPTTNEKLTVKEACAKGVVDKEDESMLFAAEAAAIGYRDPKTDKILSVDQAMRNGLINKDTALQVLQAQESVGGILDPILGVFLPKDIARKGDLIGEDLYQALNNSPKCYLDPDTQQPTTYVSLKKKCKSDTSTGLLLLPKPKQSICIRGLRNEVSVMDLVDANLLDKSDVEQLNAGKITSQEIEDRLRSYLGGSTCIAGVYDEASDKVLSIYQAMEKGILRRGTTLELLEAQAASGFMIDPINNLFLTVAEAYSRNLFGPEFKDKLIAAEKAVTGYKMPVTGKVISLFQAIENSLVEKGHGIRLLEAQIASGGIIDPQHSHRIDVNVAYKRGYFNEEMNKILTDESDDTKGFFDPNTEENLTYLELKKRCISDKKTGLVLLPIIDKKKQESNQKNTVRKRRVIIVDPETNKEMTVREAYNKGYIDYDTYLELSEQECEWEEITITASDGSTQFFITDRSTGIQYDITDLLEKQVIDQSVVDQYRSHAITITEFADIISNQTKRKSSSLSSNLISESSERSSVKSSSQGSTSGSASMSSSSVTSLTSKTSEVPAPITSSFSSYSSSNVVSRPLSPTFTKTTTTKSTTTIHRSSLSSSVTKNISDSQIQLSSVSIALSPFEVVGEVEPVGAVFDTETVEKVSITEAFHRGLVDSITAQRLLEAQACTGGIINPTDGKRVSIQEASRMGLIATDMVTKLKPAQKAYFGFEDTKVNRKLSAAQAIKEMWLPYEAGQRFLEFQVATGGLYDPEKGCRRSIEDALKMGWLDVRTAQKLQDTKHHTKNLTCPKSKLKISYKEALDNCLIEDGTRVKMLQASTLSSRGISSPYNVASAPGSTSGSRSGSQRGSRRGSLDLGSSLTQHNFTSFTSFSSTR